MTASLVQTVAGTKLKVCASAPATYDATGFNALSFTEVGEITDLGTYGKTYTLVKHNPVGDRRTVKRKGSYDNGKIALKFGKVASDAGQILLKAASDSDSSYSFLVLYADGTKNYFSAQTMDFIIELGTVDNIQKASSNLELDNDIIVA